MLLHNDFFPKINFYFFLKFQFRQKIHRYDGDNITNIDNINVQVRLQNHIRFIRGSSVKIIHVHVMKTIYRKQQNLKMEKRNPNFVPIVQNTLTQIHRMCEHFFPFDILLKTRGISVFDLNLPKTFHTRREVRASLRLLYVSATSRPRITIMVCHWCVYLHG